MIPGKAEHRFMNKRFIIFLGIAIIAIISIILLTLDGERGWRGEGTPLYTITEGTIHGGVYVSGGHGYTQENPYEENFNIPDAKIKFARLYVPVWNYNKGDTLDVRLNDESLGVRERPDYVAAFGTAQYAYNVSEKIKKSDVNVSVSYQNPNGGPYGVVLVVVYEDQSKLTRFWITEGNYALAYTTKKDEMMVSFLDAPLNVINAALWTVQAAGTPREDDLLYFNSRFLGKDVARGKNGSYFDIDEFNVTKDVSVKNFVRFERGGEGYLHPLNAMLAIEYEGQEEDNIIIHEQNSSDKSNIPLPVIAVILITAAVFFFARRRH
jgi:hypothetical protein